MGGRGEFAGVMTSLDELRRCSMWSAFNLDDLAVVGSGRGAQREGCVSHAASGTEPRITADGIWRRDDRQLRCDPMVSLRRRC